MSYAERTRRPPRTLTDLEQARLLKITGAHRDGFRDHVLLSLALGAALREMELVSLDVGDITADGVHVRQRVALRRFKGSGRDGAPATQEVFLPENAVYKLKKFLRWKRDAGQSLAPDAPLFISRHGKRLATRSVRHLFRKWQERAGFDQPQRFHNLRHSSCTNLYRRTRDIRMVQRVARHADLKTSTIYAGPSDEDVLRAVRTLPS
jgi:site-specific recombinase XerC